MKNIVIEIDGVRHKAVEAIDKSACCSTCSLQELCLEAWEQSMDCNVNKKNFKFGDKVKLLVLKEE